MYIHNEQKLIVNNCINKKIELMGNSIDLLSIDLNKYKLEDETIFKIHESIIYEIDKVNEKSLITVYFSVSDENFKESKDSKRNYFEIRNLYRVGMCSSEKEYIDSLEKIKEFCRLNNKKIEPYIYVSIRLIDKEKIIEVYVKEVSSDVKI